VYVTFATAYGTGTLGMSQQTMLNAVIGFAVTELVGIWIATRISDRIGRRPLFLLAAVVTAVYAFPLLMLINTASPALIMLALGFGGLVNGALFGIPGSLAPELFPADVRYSGAGIGYQFSGALVGGVTPVLVTGLADALHGTWGVALLLVAFGVVSLIAGWLSPETGHRPLSMDQQGVSVVGPANKIAG
jgi:MFS transporter, MHS family, shikimate and dehydroshikimate transport protein